MPAFQVRKTNRPIFPSGRSAVWKIGGIKGSFVALVALWNLTPVNFDGTRFFRRDRSQARSGLGRSRRT